LGTARAVKRAFKVAAHAADGREQELRRLAGANSAKALQSLKLQDIGHELAAAGLTALDQQARALGLSRSTTWTILTGRHKASGLSASILNRMLSSPRLPLKVRARLLEYIEEKVSGFYGHSEEARREFTARLGTDRVSLTMPRLSRERSWTGVSL
jgi:hypothetical protein